MRVDSGCGESGAFCYNHSPRVGVNLEVAVLTFFAILCVFAPLRERSWQVSRKGAKARRRKETRRKS